MTHDAHADNDDDDERLLNATRGRRLRACGPLRGRLTGLPSSSMYVYRYRIKVTTTTNE